MAGEVLCKQQGDDGYIWLWVHDGFRGVYAFFEPLGVQQKLIGRKRVFSVTQIATYSSFRYNAMNFRELEMVQA